MDLTSSDAAAKPNIADGTNWPYTRDAATELECPHYCVESGFCQKCGEDVQSDAGVKHE